LDSSLAQVFSAPLYLRTLWRYTNAVILLYYNYHITIQPLLYCSISIYKIHFLERRTALVLLLDTLRELRPFLECEFRLLCSIRPAHFQMRIRLRLWYTFSA